MSKLITAIDIGSHKVNVIIGVIEDEGKAKVIGESSYPSYGIRKGEITGIDEAINSIATALNGAERMAGLTVSSAYISINGKNIVSNNNKGVVAISDSEILEDDVLRALEQARTIAIPPGREIIHLIPREFIVDQQTGIKDPIGMTGTRLEVDAHIISAPSTVIHNIQKCIQSIGLRTEGIVFSGWASAQSVLTPTEKELGVLLLDIGGGATTITTFVEDAVTFSTAIPYGGSNVTRDLAAGLRLSLDDAEKVKVHVKDLFNGKQKLSKSKNSDDDSVNQKKHSDILDVTNLEIEGVKTISRKLFTEIVEARITEIFELVIEEIEKSNYEYKLPAGVVITGGCANLPEITGLSKKIFGIPARVGSPQGLEGLTDGIAGPSFSAAQGLIFHGLNVDASFYSTDGKFASSSPGGAEDGIIGRITGFIKNLLP